MAVRSSAVIAVRKITLFSFFTFATLLSIASPASAHTVSGVGATNFQSRIVSVSPESPSLNTRIIEAGSRIELSYRGLGTVIVRGYQNEPYLLITPKGVWRNKYSPATYINVSRKFVEAPSFADPKHAPVWIKIEGNPTVRWHDHRIHYMSPILPPAVQAHQGERRLVNNWQLHLDVEGKATTINGTLTWVPQSSPIPWVFYMLVLAGIFIALLQVNRVRWFFLPIALIGFLLTDLAYRWGIIRGISESLPTILNRDAEIFIVSQLAWIGLVFATYLALRKKDDAYVAAIFCAVPLTIVSGLTDIVVLWKSQVPSLYGKETTRLLLATDIALGFALAIGSFIYLLRTRSQRVVSRNVVRNAEV
jgi:hypothetical protein